MKSHPTAALLVVALVAATCSRGSMLGRDEAVEILVIDGLDRSEAACLVDQVADELDLSEVTGISGDLDPSELAVLFEASRVCQPNAVAGAGGVGGGSLDELSDLEGAEQVAGIDVEGVVAELLRGGLDPETAVCVASMLLGGDDPAVAVSDHARQIDAIVACDSG